ncbi:MAG: selenium cofactor biosynthesis protein YqeC [Chloroflexota bacterium]
MNLAQALRFPISAGQATTIAFAGAGGKTTALFQLAREISPPVIVSSTTHLGAWQIPLADRHIIAETASPIEELEHGLNGIILITGPICEDKTSPINQSLLEWLRAFCGYHDLPLLIEADGSRQKPLKAPAEHEPAIPEFVEHVVYVAGLSVLDKPLSGECVHRPEIFSHLSGLAFGERVTTDALARVLSHPLGGLKNIPPASKRTLILNQADSADLQSRAGSMSPALLEGFDSVIVASLGQGQIHAVHERTAGIILAAGASTRYGQPKQLLDWRGKPFVRAVAETALSAVLSPVIVVTGANAEEVEKAIQDLPVAIVRNEAWQCGQGSSIKAGLSILTPSQPPPNPHGESTSALKSLHADLGEVPARAVGVGSVVFLLADQPHIGADVIRALVETHARELHPVVVPLVLEERRANPVLFDRITFPDLLTLEGDVGGRAIFSKYKVEYMPWHDDRLLLDVDKPEDYQRLTEDETL